MTANTALEEFVHKIPLFAAVTGDELKAVLSLLTPVSLNAGDVLFRQGEAGKAMWVLGDGAEVTINATPTGQSRAVAVAYARAGDVVGEMALLDEGPRSATALVTRAGPAQRIDAAAFAKMRLSFEPAAFKVLRQLCVELCKRLRKTSERIVTASRTQVASSPPLIGPHPQVEVLNQFPAFRTLPAVVKLALVQKLQLVEVPEITPVFAEGEASDGAWFLLEGEVLAGRNGKTLSTLVPGTTFGIISAIDGQPRSASCVTSGPARLLKLADADFDSLFASGNRFAFQLVDLIARQLVAHLRQTNAMIPVPGRETLPAAPVAPVETLLPNDEEETIVGEELESMPIELEVDFAELTAVGEALG